MGRMNFPCSTVKAQTEKSTGARLASISRASSNVRESLPPDNATATRSPLRIILKRPTASPTLRRRIFSRSKIRLYGPPLASVDRTHDALDLPRIRSRTLGARDRLLHERSNGGSSQIL